MTIAAGFLCDEGLLMCADTEYTSGDADKGEGSKIHRRELFGIELLFTGCLDRALISMTADKICDALDIKEAELLRLDLEERMEEIRRIITEENRKIHSEHLVYCHPPIPQAELLIGYLSRDQNSSEVRMIHLANNTVENINFYECIGAGAAIGKWLSRIFYYDSCPIALLKVAALFIVQEAKKNVPYCGGATHIYTLKKNPDSKKVMTFWDDEGIARDVEGAMRDMLFLPRDPTISDESKFEDLLRVHTNKIRDIWRASHRPKLQEYVSPTPPNLGTEK